MAISSIIFKAGKCLDNWLGETGTKLSRSSSISFSESFVMHENVSVILYKWSGSKATKLIWPTLSKITKGV